MDQQDLATLVAVQGQNQESLSTIATAAAVAAAQSFTAWYDHQQIAAWAAAVAARIEAIQSQSASATDAYLAEALANMKGARVAPAGTINVADLRKGVSHTEVYGRAADVFRYQRSLGKTEEQAQAAAVQRAKAIADTDVALAARAQSHKFMVVKNVSGYRRIIHPELSAGGTCGLCIAASTRFYHRADLMPLHGNCKCTTLPIINSIDPGHTLNRDDLNALYAQAGSTNAAKLKRVRYQLHDNGELGPVLGVEGQAFRGPADVRADAA